MQTFAPPPGLQLWRLLPELVLLLLPGIHELLSRTLHAGSSGRYTLDSPILVRTVLKVSCATWKALKT